MAADGSTTPEIQTIPTDTPDENPATRAELICQAIKSTDDPGITAAVYEQTRGNKEALAYLYPIEIEDLNIHEIERQTKQDYGGGSYRLQVRKDGRFLLNHPFIIGGRRRARLDDEAPAKPAADGTAAITELIRAGQAQTAAILERLANAPKRDAGADMRQMLELMASMREAMGMNVAPAPAAPSIIEQLQSLAALRESFAEFFGAGGEQRNEWARVVEKFAPRLLDAAEKEKEKNEQSTRRPTQQKIEARPMNVELQTGINMMLNAARANEDTTPYAIMLMAKLSDEQLNTYVLADDALRRLASLHPAVNTYAGWFTELRDDIIELMADHDQIENDSTNDSTDDAPAVAQEQ